MVQLLKDTAIVDLKQYVELVEIKNAVDAKRKIMLSFYHSATADAQYIFADPEDIQSVLCKENELYRQKYDEMKSALYHSENAIKTLKEEAVQKYFKFFNMSVWQFLKWKKQQLKSK